ncbi:MAG: hypothetical protein NC133_04035 [Prevotella sp.]|nr:hypothetical protein [Prevotella sp.]
MNYVGKIVTLKKDFIRKAQSIDDGFPSKVERPYLIVELPTKQGNKLFAIPFQTNISSNVKEKFYEKLSYRLETSSNCESGLVFSQIVPITDAQIDMLKSSEELVPSDNGKRNAILYNLKNLEIDKIPEKACQAFMIMKKMANSKNNYDIFSNSQFRDAYSIVSNEIFNEAIKNKDRKFEQIIKKAEDYLRLYVKFVRQNIYKKNRNLEHEKRIKIPKVHTRLDKLFKFLDAYNLTKKYKLTDEQFAAAEKVATKDKKDLEKMIRKNIEFAKDGEYDAGVKAQVLAEQAKARAERQKQSVPKTQEKIAPKQPKKNTAQNSR